MENRESSTMSEFKQVKINKCSQDSQPRLGKEPVRMICPKCSQEMTTKVEHKPSIYAWMTGIALACFGYLILEKINFEFMYIIILL